MNRRSLFFWVIAFATIITTGCGLKMDNSKRNLAKEKADALIQRIEDGSAENEFIEANLPVEQMASALRELHDSCRFKVGNAIYVTGVYSKSLMGQADQMSFFYKYYLKSDSLKIMLIYNLNDSVRFTNIKVGKFN